MSWTTEWMRDWLSSGSPRRTQATLAKFAGLGPANVSRWLSHQSKPDQEAIDSIVSHLDEIDALQLTRAWLEDHTPPAARRLLGTSNAEMDGADFPAGMSHELRQQLIQLGAIAMNHADARQVLDLVYHLAMRPRPFDIESQPAKIA